MANHVRASRALLFMQQCRQQALAPAPAPARLSKDSPRHYTNNSSLDPENFGKKLRLDQSTADPIPAWRLPTQELQAAQSNGVSESIASNPYDFPRARDQPVPRYRHNPAVAPGLWSFLKYRILRIPEPDNPHLTDKPAFNVLTNPYKARKTWPPILSQMTEIQQFHYEKKFRRRLLNKTKSMRFNWDRWALFARRFSVGFLIVYFALFAEPPDPKTRVPPDGLRYWMYGQLRKGNGTELGGEGVQFWPGRVGPWVESQYQYYKLKHKRQWDPYNHDGWDDSRPRNSLPGKVAPAVNRPLSDPTSTA